MLVLLKMISGASFEGEKYHQNMTIVIKQLDLEEGE